MKTAKVMTLRTGKHAGRAAQPRGFTLLELLVVISIIGLLMTGALVMVEGLGRKMKFEGAGKALRDKIMLTRNVAISQNHKLALRVTQTQGRKWKLVIIDSVDGILDNGDDKMVGDPWYFPRQIDLEAEQELEFGAEGGITFTTSNPIVLLDNSDKKEPWRMKMTIYTASGMVRMGEIEKLTPDTGATNAAATAEAPAAEETFDETTASAEKS
jgi:prepilin-type N-terminal cleavage/methylation domain-containing protein